MDLRTAKDVGAFVREQRRCRLGWTQEELAHRVGVSRLWIVQLEGGKATAQLGLVLRVLRELGVRLDASPPGSSGHGAVGASDPGDGVDLDVIINRLRAPQA